MPESPPKRTCGGIETLLARPWSVAFARTIRGLSLVGWFACAASTAPGEAVPAKADLFAAVFDEVAELFQEGEEPVDVDAVKEMLLACEPFYDEMQPPGNQANAFYEGLARLFDYLDTHRLTAADVVALREWQAGLFECRDSEGTDWSDPNPTLIPKIVRSVWDRADSMGDNWAHAEPRHAIFLEVLCAVPTGYRLEISALQSETPLRKDVAPARDGETKIVLFLKDPARASLREAALAIRAHTDKLYENEEYATSSFDAQKILEFRREPAKFKRLFDAYLPRCDNSVNRALPHDRGWLYAEMRFLRAMWNMVHAYGDAESQAAMKARLVSMRSDFAAQSDQLAVRWLDQVMAKPGRHPSFFSVTLVPVKDKKPAKK